MDIFWVLFIHYSPWRIKKQSKNTKIYNYSLFIISIIWASTFRLKTFKKHVKQFNQMCQLMSEINDIVVVLVTQHALKGHWLQNSHYKLFEHKLLEVCVHIHPMMIIIHQCFILFFNPYFKIPFLKSGCSEILIRMMQFCTHRCHDSLLTRPSYLRPALSELRAVRQCVDFGGGENKMSQIKRLRM